MATTQRLNHSTKVIVTAALTGAVTTKQNNPHLPTQPKEIAEAALRCYEAGAAMVHIHVRDDDDSASMRFDKFEETVRLIRETGCPVLLNLTSSGGQGFSWEERIRPFKELKPELASFDAGTMNWLNSVVFMNEPKFLELCGQEMIAANVKPEIEIFDMGMLNTAKYYLKTGVLQAPAHFQLCLGAPGGMEATTENLLYLVNHLPEDCTWSTFGIGRGANEITLAALALGGNIRVGNSEVFLTEACEYTNSFLSFFPTIGIILNIDADHLDFFKDIEDIRRSFRKFAQLLPGDGTLIINADTPEYLSVIEDLPCRVITYSLTDSADYTASDITYDQYGHASFTVNYQGAPLGVCSLKVPGIHNVSNALASIAAGRVLDLPWEVIARGLESFTGTDRRFQYKGTVAGVTIIDDYAHHPTEIRATLHAARNYPHKKIWCVFQPHTYTRTKALMPEFAAALSLADHVVLADIYAARETDTLGISSEDLQKDIAALGTPCEYFPTFDEIENYLLEHCEPGDLLITMGAGDVFKIGEKLLGM